MPFRTGGPPVVGRSAWSVGENEPLAESSRPVFGSNEHWNDTTVGRPEETAYRTLAKPLRSTDGDILSKRAPPFTE